MNSFHFHSINASVFIIELVLLHFQVQYIKCVLVLFLISLGKAHTHPYHIHCISRNKPSRSDSTNASDWVLFACTLIFIRTLTFVQFFETLRSLTVHFPFKMNSHFDVLQLDKDIERSSRETLGWITKKERHTTVFSSIYSYFMQNWMKWREKKPLKWAMLKSHNQK